MEQLNDIKPTLQEQIETLNEVVKELMISSDQLKRSLKLHQQAIQYQNETIERMMQRWEKQREINTNFRRRIANHHNEIANLHHETGALEYTLMNFIQSQKNPTK